MEKSYPVTRLGSLVLLSGLIVTLFVSPWNSVDPVNLPKMTFLGVLAIGCLGLLLGQVYKFNNSGGKTLVRLVVLFQIQITMLLFFVAGDFAFKFYGTPNRNTGFLTYTCLNILLLAAAVASDEHLLKKAGKSLILLSSLLSLYGLAQSRGIEVFPYVNVYGSSVFSTLGNPNFQSAFMGISGSVVFAWLVLYKCTIKTKLFLLAILVICFYNISLTSQQGYLALGSGTLATIMMLLYVSKRFILFKLVAILTIIGAVLTTFAVFNLGPLSRVIYETSLQARRFYWQAAIKMMIDHPFLGVGLDGFGDQYYRSRPISAVEFNQNISSDTAHNVALDIGSSGGIPLFFVYLGIIVLTILSIVRTMRRSKQINVFLISIVSAWVAYMVQSLISINQIGIGVWGWILSGLIIGYDIDFKSRFTADSHQYSKLEKKAKSELEPKQILSVAVALLVGFGLSIPAYVGANQFYRVLQSGDFDRLERGSSIKPYDRTRFYYAAQILIQNKREEQGIKILREAVLLYPNYYQLWKLWSSTSSSSPAEIARANAELKRLDPYNPDLK